MCDPDFGSIDLADEYDIASEPQFTHGCDLVELLAIRRGERVLDVGCGTGRLAAIVAERVGTGGRVAGIDPAPARIEVARRRGDGPMEFHVGSSEDLSAFAPESFDVVYLNSVLVWVADKPTALAQARRVLARGGRLGIATTVREPPNELRLLIRDAKDEAMGRPGRRLRRRTMSPGGQADLLAGAGRRVTPGGVRGLLQASGFSIRVCELRTYLSEFEDVAGIISFLRATSFGRMLSDMTSTDLARFAAALERVIADEIPASRRTGGIRLERHVLLAVAEKS